ncbi:hypothetical protein VNO77_03150 [Canavalia gladiata]|uniref:Uncharacterized protein n=1 Tax=Canavalia gladiata TaxID=3824 RepID=A0AAN9R6K0_CANGL
MSDKACEEPQNRRGMDHLLKDLQIEDDFMDLDPPFPRGVVPQIHRVIRRILDEHHLSALLASTDPEEVKASFDTSSTKNNRWKIKASTSVDPELLPRATKQKIRDALSSLVALVNSSILEVAELETYVVANLILDSEIAEKDVAQEVILPAT